MVKVPRLDPLRLPRRLTQRLRARVRAETTRWRRRLRRQAAAAESEVLFPTLGRGAIAVDTLAGEFDASGPRLAILHATAGSGHKRAAQALAAALAAERPDALVREVDTLVFASRWYRGTYAQSYNAMAARAPALWAALYHSSAMGPVHRGTAPVRLAVDRLNLTRLVRVVERERPDAVVCTHFLPVEALSHARGRGRLGVPLYCVITDFTAHPFWAFPYVDRYFVAGALVADELVAHGIARDRIEVSGIPIDPVFASPRGREAACARLGLDPARRHVLVMGGGAGVGPIAELAERLADVPSAPVVVAVCGHNTTLRKRLARGAAARRGGLRALGFTHDVDALLEACEAVVSKAGGLTCSEALAKRTPLVVFRPTPGQEVQNTRYLVSGGAAVHAESVDEVCGLVETWLSNPPARARVREAAARLAQADAAAVIGRRVLADLAVRARSVA